MDTDNEGRTNAQYVTWLSGTACQDCNNVREIYVKFENGDEQTLHNDSDIYNFMHNPDESEVATFMEVKYSGKTLLGLSWDAVDARLQVNLERTVNEGFVPIKIKRPIGY